MIAFGTFTVELESNYNLNLKSNSAVYLKIFQAYQTNKWRISNQLINEEFQNTTIGIQKMSISKLYAWVVHSHLEIGTETDQITWNFPSNIGISVIYH